MTIADSKKVDLLWKKVGYGVTKTDNTTRKSPSNESISSPLLIRGDRIWTQSDQIPNTLPQTSSEYVQVHSDYLGNTVECVMDITSTPNRTWKTSQIDWIPIEFGSTYQVKVYVDDPAAGEPSVTGTRLFADGTGNDEWYFDYSAGVLHFIGESLPSGVVQGKVIYVTGARYVGNVGLGGFDPDTTGSQVQPGIIPTSQAFTGNGSQTVYMLSHTPASNEALDVYVNDVLQRPGEVWELQNNTVQFLLTPPTGTDIFIKYRYPFATVIDLPVRSVEEKHLKLTYTSDQYTADGAQSTFDINPGHTENDILVIVDGLIIPPQQYSVVGTVLTITNPPSNTSLVDIRYLPV